MATRSRKAIAAVLSGGGRNGAWTVGAMIGALTRGVAAFAGVFGVSTGNLSAAVMASRNADLEAARLLQRIYLRLRGNRSIYHGSQFLPLELVNFLLRPSLFDPIGLRQLIDRYVDMTDLRGSPIAFGCGATCVETGEYRSITNASVSEDWILASASMPVFFPAVAIDGRHWVDGGVRHQTPLREAVHWLRAQPADEHELHVFLCSPTVPPLFEGKPRGVAMAVRALQLLETSVFLNDLNLLRARNSSPGYVTIRHAVYSPYEDLGNSLDFDPQTIQRLLYDGMQARPVWSA